MTCYSHSRLSTFEQCPYKYKLHYIDKITVDIPTTIEAFMGDMVHQTLEKLYKDLKFQKINSLKELLKFYNGLWEKEVTDDILVVKEEYSAENYRKMGEQYITDYYNQYTPFNQITVLGLETMDKMRLSDGIHYHVRIDKLGCTGNTYFVCDYKTNSRLKNQEEADADRQLAMYSIWVKNKFKDAKQVKLLWHMLAFNKEVISERSDKELDKLHKETVALIKKIENTKQFRRKTSNLCSYCVYKSQCPSFKHEFSIKDKPVKEFKKDDGVVLVDAFAQYTEQKREAEAKLEEIKENLIKFCKQNEIDVVYGSNKKASVKEFMKIVLPEDKDKFIQLLKKKGLYEKFSMICFPKLQSSILNEKIDKSISNLVGKESGFKVGLSKK